MSQRIVNEDEIASTDGGEIHEVAAQITVPREGGWGWVVVASSFFSIFILDGVAFTFGSLLKNISADLTVSDSLVALVNSTAVALYFIASPLASALINRFGFRECAMSGSVICSFSLLISYFSTKFPYVFIFYGITAGLGFSLINMSSGLIVGFYFEKLRSLALAIATCGSSVGVMTLFPMNTYLVNLGGWRTTTLLHSGLFGIVFYLGMTYRPLLSFTVTKTDEETTRTLAYLPSVSVTTTMLRPSTTTSIRALTPTVTERLFGAVSNVNFPTAAKVVDDTVSVASAQPGPSNVAQSKSRLVLTAPSGTMGLVQLQQVQSEIKKTETKAQAKKSLLARTFHWDPHESRSRPLYRDDAFYTGQLKDLPAYQKSMIDTSAEGATGLEYQMAVTRAVALTDLHEQRGFYTTACRRVLATMMDPNLLKKYSFILMCCSGFFTYLGFLVPYVYLQDRNLKAGLAPEHCTLFISTIGLSNAIGRLVLGYLGSKVDPIKLFAFWCSMAGISTIFSDVSFNVYYQYFYCCVFGFSIASVACLRSIILVSLYGLDKLTNATGMMLIFLGIGNLISTPLAGMLKSNYGYRIAFYSAGGFMTLSGLILIPVKFYAKREQTAEEVLNIRNKQQQQLKPTEK